MKDVQRVRKLRRVDGAIGIRVVPFDNLHDARSAEALERLGCGVGFTALRRIKRVTDIPANLQWKIFYVVTAGSNPNDWPYASFIILLYHY